ncbi:MAG: efflux system, rane fusion protein CmeA [Myxococcaceae bacterium]|nr:efflux system, rane fusion protein CmeA [Myxococcaceae bacterium]
MRLPGLVAVLAIFVAAACTREAPKQGAPPPPKVVVAPVMARPVELFSENVGQLDGYVNAEIRARVRGYLKEQLYRDGSHVKAGQLLFTIDPVEYQAALESARGTLARAHAAVQLAKQQFDRSEALIKTGTVTKRSLDDATAALADATGQERAAQAAVRQAELNLSYTQLRSPIDGIAGLALVRVGNLVGQDGPTRLTTVSTIDPMRVRFPISERDYLKNAKKYQELGSADANKVKDKLVSLDQASAPDESVALVLADDSTYERRGLIISTDREINPSTGTIQVEALFANPEGILRPGQYARIRSKRTDSTAASIVVPQKALLETQGTFSVAVLKADNKVELRRVEVGPTSGEDRVVTKGLAAGEKIVIEGVQKVADGALVVPQAAPENTDVKAAAATPKP